MESTSIIYIRIKQTNFRLRKLIVFSEDKKMSKGDCEKKREERN